MESRIVERAEAPYLDKKIERGDVFFLNTGEQVVVIRSMGDDWRYLVGVLPPEDEGEEYGEQMHADDMDQQAMYSDLRRGG